MRTFLGFVKDFFRTLSGFSQDFLRIFSGFSQDFLRTFSGLSKEVLKTSLGFSLDFLGNFSKPYQYYTWIFKFDSKSLALICLPCYSWCHTDK